MVLKDTNDIKVQYLKIVKIWLNGLIQMSAKPNKIEVKLEKTGVPTESILFA